VIHIAGPAQKQSPTRRAEAGPENDGARGVQRRTGWRPSRTSSTDRMTFDAGAASGVKESVEYPTPGGRPGRDASKSLAGQRDTDGDGRVGVDKVTGLRERLKHPQALPSALRRRRVFTAHGHALLREKDGKEVSRAGRRPPLASRTDTHELPQTGDLGAGRLALRASTASQPKAGRVVRSNGRCLTSPEPLWRVHCGTREFPKLSAQGTSNPLGPRLGRPRQHLVRALPTGPTTTSSTSSRTATTAARPARPLVHTQDRLDHHTHSHQKTAY